MPDSLEPFRHTFSHYHLWIRPLKLSVRRTNSLQDDGRLRWLTREQALKAGLPAPSAASWNVTNFESTRIHARLAGNHSECTLLIASNTPAQAPSLADRLRAETRPEHDSIETALALPQSIQDAGDYARLLAGFYGFYLPLERALLSLAWEGTGIDLHERLKAPLIRTDLEACGAEADYVPRCPTLPPCASVAEGFRCLYVMEGPPLAVRSSTGNSAPDSATGSAARTITTSATGPAGALMWRQFRQALDRFGEQCSSADQDHVIHSARATFRELQRWLEG